MPLPVRSCFRDLVLGPLIAGALTAAGQTNTVTLPSVADTSLFEYAPNNNLGAVSDIPIGTTAQFVDRGRGLYKFDIAGNVPPGARIVSAALSLSVTAQTSNPNHSPVNSNFDLHRVLVAWGEGTGIASQGSPATNGEATWRMRFYPSTPWTQPGGAAPTDFVALASAKVFVKAPTRYTFLSTSNLVADVQFWLDQPANNFGWIVISESESIAGTARRVATRGNSSLATRPSLVVQFVVPPQLGSVAITNNQFQFAFTTQTNQSYAIEFLPAFDFSTNLVWSLLTNLTATATNLVVSDPIAPNAQRFYRVRLP